MFGGLHREGLGAPVEEGVYVEVPFWDFGDATSRSVNPFADGTLGTE